MTNSIMKSRSILVHSDFRGQLAAQLQRFHAPGVAASEDDDGPGPFGGLGGVSVVAGPAAGCAFGAATAAHVFARDCARRSDLGLIRRAAGRLARRSANGLARRSGLGPPRRSAGPLARRSDPGPDRSSAGPVARRSGLGPPRRSAGPLARRSDPGPDRRSAGPLARRSDLGPD